MKKILDEKNFEKKKKIEKKKIFFSKNESCLKLPELPRNHISRGGGCCHGQTDDITE